MRLLWIMHDAIPILSLLLIDGKSQTFVSHRITRGAASCFLISWCWGSNELIFYYWHPCPFMYNNVMLGTGAWKTLLGHHNHVLLFFFNEWINCFIRRAGTFFKKEDKFPLLLSRELRVRSAQNFKRLLSVILNISMLQWYHCSKYHGTLSSRKFDRTWNSTEEKEELNFMFHSKQFDWTWTLCVNHWDLRRSCQSACREI